MELPNTALAIREAVVSGKLSAASVVEQTFARMEAATNLGAFLTSCRAHAEETARNLDAQVQSGAALGPLAGVPIAVKDALATSFAPTTSASRILCKGQSADSGFRPPYDATVVEKLRAAGAIIVGKTNMDEFAMGSSNENSAFFPARNPHDPSRIPGGSSGGSAVAVAAKLTPIAIGSDTGGSIRQPAAMCGVVGVKPSYGRVSRFGLFAFASSLDQIGVFAHDVRDAALAMQVIGGFDARDATSREIENPAWSPAAASSLSGLRVGVPSEYFGEGIHAGVRASVEQAIEQLRALGATTVPVSLPNTRFAVAAYYVLATAEASSNLSRYDGVRFGLRVEKSGQSLKELYKGTRGRGFGSEVKRRIILGTFVLSSGYYDAYYKQAEKVRALISADFQRVFDQVDVLATPTSPTVAFPLGARTHDPLAMYLADICTLPASLAGLPALSLPCAPAAPAEGGSPLPVGLQLIGRSFEEARLYDVAHAFLEAQRG
jgi:aspartyl-tRNA(Asn)/glutamyl-tRNA(Gln) amidotransferase subunit A